MRYRVHLVICVIGILLFRLFSEGCPAAAAELLPIEKIIGVERGGVLIDGLLETEMSLEPEQAVILDLGRNLPIDRVILYTDGPAEALTVLFSSDGVRWLPPGLTEREPGSTGRQPGKLTASNGNRPAQLIRIICDTTVAIREIECRKGTATSIRILSQQVNFPSDTAAEVVFVTDRPCAAGVSYSTRFLQINQVKLVSMVDTDHRIMIDGLDPGTEHYYVLRAIDEAGRFDETPISKFTTTGLAPLRIFDISISNIRNDRVFLNWTTNTMSYGKVQYGDSIGYLPAMAIDTVPSGSHQLELTGLSPERTYYYRIYAKDIYQQEARSHKGTFTTSEYNIALYRPVTGTFNLNIDPAYIADTPPIINRVNDNNFDYFGGMAACRDPLFGDQYLVMDLMEPAPLQRTEFYWRATCYPQKYDLYASLNGIDWDVVAKDLNGDSAEPAEIAGNPIRIHRINLGDRIARYLKFYMKQGSPYYQKRKSYRFLALHEWKVVPVY